MLMTHVKVLPQKSMTSYKVLESSRIYLLLPRGRREGAPRPEEMSEREFPLTAKALLAASISLQAIRGSGKIGRSNTQ